MTEAEALRIPRVSYRDGEVAWVCCKGAKVVVLLEGKGMDE